MPIHDYRCELCKHVWEEITKMDESPKECPCDIEITEDMDTETKRKAMFHSYNDAEYIIKKLPALFANMKSNWSKWQV